MAKAAMAVALLLLLAASSAHGQTLHNLFRGTEREARCEGTLVKNETFPLDQCTSYMGQYGYKVTCDGKTLTESYYKDQACKDKVGGEPFPVGKCVIPPESRGSSQIFTCEGESFHVMTWSSSPAPPQSVECKDDVVKPPGSLAVKTEVNATLVDQVSFEVAVPSGHVFLSYSAQVGADGKVLAVIPGLHPSMQYNVSVRSHSRGEEEGNPDTWSILATASALCSSGGSTAPAPLKSMSSEAADKAPKVATRWLEVYRYASGAQLPDFLDQHNTGDLLGEFTIAGSEALVKGVPLTRYCVEILDVSFPDIITDNSDGVPTLSHFANYASCIRGVCRCMHQVDRTLAGLPAKQIMDLCSNPAQDINNNTCICSRQSDEQTGEYVGRAIIPLPFHTAYSVMYPNFTLASDYRPSGRPSPVGYWFSFPNAGHCPIGTQVGYQGCTWQRSPISHTVYTEDLLKMGMNTSVLMNIKKMTEDIDFDVSLQNALAGDRAFRSLPADIPACGDRAWGRRAQVQLVV